MMKKMLKKNDEKILLSYESYDMTHNYEVIYSNWSFVRSK